MKSNKDVKSINNNLKQKFTSYHRNGGDETETLNMNDINVNIQGFSVVFCFSFHS